MKTAKDVKYIGELPGDGPWQFVKFRDIVLVVSPNGRPMIIRDGRLEDLRLDAEKEVAKWARLPFSR